MKFNSRRTIRLYFDQILLYKWWSLLILAALLMSVFASMAWPIVVREFFSILSQGWNKEVAVAALIGMLLWLMLVEAVEWTGWRAVGFTMAHIQPRMMANLANKCFNYLHGHSHAFFSDNFSGALVKRVNRFVRSFETMHDRLIFDMIPLTVRLLIIIAVLAYLNLLFGLVMIVWTVLFLLITWKLSMVKLKYDLARSKADTRVTAVLADTITNSDNVKLFAANEFEGHRFKEVTDFWAEAISRSFRLHSLFDGFQALLMIVLEFVVLYLAIKLWEVDKLVLADFFLIQAYMFETFHQLWNFGRNIRDMYERLAEAEEMTQILHTPHKVRDRKGAGDLMIPNGNVDFKKVTFSYAKSGESVMKNLSLRVRAGEKVALIGPSGGGKTTLMKLLLRQYDLKGGKIEIDGRDISKFMLKSLHENIALVPQDPILFHRSLLENIRYGRREATMEEVVAAAKMAHCDEFISQLSKGYNTFVGERGIKLSGGQRQRVAIARAILSNAKILILDEATSSLDSESEMLIQKALENLMKQKTTFIVAHRLSTIMKADRIFVLQGGQIVESGSHADLVNKKGSLYGKLWDLQVGGYRLGEAS